MNRLPLATGGHDKARAFRVQFRRAAGLFPLAKRSDRDADPGRELGLRSPSFSRVIQISLALFAGPPPSAVTSKSSASLGSALRAARGTVPGFFQGGPDPLGPKYTQSFGNGWSLTFGATTDGSARGFGISYV